VGLGDVKRASTRSIRWPSGSVQVEERPRSTGTSEIRERVEETR
jgi:hypothetical protein